MIGYSVGAILRLVVFFGWTGRPCGVAAYDPPHALEKQPDRIALLRRAAAAGKRCAGRGAGPGGVVNLGSVRKGVLVKLDDEPRTLSTPASGHWSVFGMRFDDGLSITASSILTANLEEFDEPTLGAIAGDDFYFVANSHWNRFDQENRLLNGLSGPIVLRVPLDPQ